MRLSTKYVSVKGYLIPIILICFLVPIESYSRETRILCDAQLRPAVDLHLVKYALSSQASLISNHQSLHLARSWFGSSEQYFPLETNLGVKNPALLAVYSFEIQLLPLTIKIVSIVAIGLMALLLYRAHKSANLANAKFQFYSGLLEDSPVPIIVYKNLQIIYANKSFERLTGYTKKEIAGTKIFELVHPESFSDISVSNWFQVRLNQSWNSDLQLQCNNKQVKWVNFSAQLTDYNGEEGTIASVIDISSRLDERASENELMMRQALLLHSCSEGLFDYNLQSRELYLSLQWKEMLGYSENEVINTFSNWQAMIHPEDFNLFDEFMRMVVDGIPSGNVYEFRTKCRDNSYKWIQVKFSVAFGSGASPMRVLGVQNDVSRVKELETRLNEFSKTQTGLLSSNMLPTLLVDKNTQDIVSASAGACRLYGFTGEEFQKLKYYELVHMSHATLPAQLPEKVIHKSRGHELLHVGVYRLPVILDGKEMEVLSIVDETAFRNEIDELKMAKEVCEKSSLLKSSFLSGASHEIRTPLNSIIGLVELITPDESLPETLRENLKSIKFSSKHLLGVVNDVLDFSKLEAGKVILDSENFNLPELVKETTKSIEHTTQPKGIQLKVHINPNLPEFVVGDEGRIRQILLNLLSNAVKFTSEGNINVYARLSETTENLCKVRISVSDTGIGIPESKIKVIFDSYTQADQRIFRKYGGTGLGLPICKKLVELLGGEIGVKSIEGIGSNFWFEVPLELSTKTDSETGFETIDTQVKNLKGLKILLVEDDSMNRFVMAQFFKKWNAQLFEAENGREAIAMLSNDLFDIVLMDLYMPEMDGMEAAQLIRQGNARVLDAGVPIIALTADTSEDVKERIIAAGMDDLVIKPSEPDVLYKKIVTISHLNRKKRTSIGSPGKVVLANTLDETGCEITDRTLAAIHAIFDDDKGAAHSMLMHLLQQLPRITSKVQLYVDKGVGELAAQALHRIKPGFQHLGFIELNARLVELQNLLRNPKQRNMVNAKLSQFFAELEKAEKILKKVASEIESPPYQGLN